MQPDPRRFDRGGGGMKRGESTHLALRWILGQPVETLLLILGITLGIGATASGLALAWHGPGSA